MPSRKTTATRGRPPLCSNVRPCSSRTAPSTSAACGLASPFPPTALRSVTPRANCAPPKHGKSCDSTSIFWSSVARTPTFMSRKRALNFTRAPASRHMRANVLCTLNQELPCTLQIGDSRDGHPQLSLFGDAHIHLALNVLRGSNWCAQNRDALWLPSVWFHIFHVLGDNAGVVPRSRVPGATGCLHVSKVPLSTLCGGVARKMVGRADRCRREKQTSALLVPVSGPPPPMHSVFQWKTEVASGGRHPQLETARRHPGQTIRTSMVVRKRGARKAKFSGHGASACRALPTKECRCRRQCRPRSRLSTWDQHQWLPAACARHNLSLLWSTGRVETARTLLRTPP